MFYMLWFYPTFVECYADCFNAISCPICLIHWTVLHRRDANDFKLWLATNLCNFCLYNMIMPATMISCPLPRIIHGIFDARYQSMLQSMHAQILFKVYQSTIILDQSLVAWIVSDRCFLKFTLSGLDERDIERKRDRERVRRKRTDKAFMLLITVYPVYVINQFRQWLHDRYCTNYRLLRRAIYVIDLWYIMHIVHTINSWCMLHMSSIYDTCYRMLMLVQCDRDQ